MGGGALRLLVGSGEGWGEAVSHGMAVGCLSGARDGLNENFDRVWAKTSTNWKEEQTRFRACFNFQKKINFQKIFQVKN
jgi:hypothetical protein